jgi:4-diphosphocytidyl-2-C-methyl-D-erythritol kinase
MMSEMGENTNIESRTITLDAPAKINLGLEVLRRRPDGYHDINTIFAAVDLCDRLTFRSRDDGEIVCRVEGNDALAAEPVERNLSVRAAALLKQELGERRGIDIVLEKAIPAGAGLGGGSSDAATTLRGAALLWGADITPERMTALATALGSDVPFFLRGGVAIGRSRGEALEPLDEMLPWHVLLVNPAIHVATPWAYGTLGRDGSMRVATDFAGALRDGLADPSTLRTTLVNDFEEPVATAHPVIRRVKRRLLDNGAFHAAMSGSGSTLFGLFGERDDAEKAAEGMEPWWRVVTAFRRERGREGKGKREQE